MFVNIGNHTAHSVLYNILRFVHLLFKQCALSLARLVSTVILLVSSIALNTLPTQYFRLSTSSFEFIVFNQKTTKKSPQPLNSMFRAHHHPISQLRDQFLSLSLPQLRIRVPLLHDQFLVPPVFPSLPSLFSYTPRDPPEWTCRSSSSSAPERCPCWRTDPSAAFPSASTSPNNYRTPGAASSSRTSRPPATSSARPRAPSDTCPRCLVPPPRAETHRSPCCGGRSSNPAPKKAPILVPSCSGRGSGRALWCDRRSSSTLGGSRAARRARRCWKRRRRRGTTFQRAIGAKRRLLSVPVCTGRERSRGRGTARARAEYRCWRSRRSRRRRASGRLWAAPERRGASQSWIWGERKQKGSHMYAGTKSIPSDRQSGTAAGEVEKSTARKEKCCWSRLSDFKVYSTERRPAWNSTLTQRTRR